MHPMTAARALLNADPATLQPLIDKWESEDHGTDAQAQAYKALADAIGRTIERIDLRASDRFGRAIGCEISTAQIGGAFLGQAQATRDGRAYQASQPLLRFDSEKARDTWRRKYLAAAQKRAAARAGK